MAVQGVLFLAVVIIILASFKVDCGNFTDLPSDIQTRIFFRLTVLDRLRVRKVDRLRNRIIKGVKAGEDVLLNHFSSTLHAITDDNFYRRNYLTAIRYNANYLKHCLGFFQSMRENTNIIKNNSKLSAKHKQLLLGAMNVTSGKCVLCFTNGKRGYFCNRYGDTCNYCASCLREWMQNKTHSIRCPVCAIVMDGTLLNAPFANFPQPDVQPGYAESDNQSCCYAITKRLDIKNGCIDHFVCSEWDLIKCIWCSLPREDVPKIAACSIYAIRALLGVPATCVIAAGVTLGLSASACCCCDCCYLCFPETSCRQKCMSIADLE